MNEASVDHAYVNRHHCVLCWRFFVKKFVELNGGIEMSLEKLDEWRPHVKDGVVHPTNEEMVALLKKATRESQHMIAFASFAFGMTVGIGLAVIAMLLTWE